MAAKTGTYTLIASNTLGSAAASVTFSSIPATYTDLVLVSNVSGSGGNANLRITFNSDTGTNYSTTALSGDGTTAVSNRSTSQTAMLVVQTGASLNGAWTTYISHFMDYSNTTTYKTALSRFVAAGSETTANVHLWRSTSAVTSITVATSTNNYASGSTFKLYGIEAGNL
jgi:hypothetical protein